MIRLVFLQLSIGYLYCLPTIKGSQVPQTSKYSETGIQSGFSFYRPFSSTTKCICHFYSSQSVLQLRVLFPRQVQSLKNAKSTGRGSCCILMILHNMETFAIMTSLTRDTSHSCMSLLAFAVCLCYNLSRSMAHSLPILLHRPTSRGLISKTWQRTT